MRPGSVGVGLIMPSPAGPSRNACRCSSRNLKKPRHREHQYIWVSVVQAGPGQKVRTDHFQTVASGAVASQHQSCRFDRPLNDWHLAMVKFRQSPTAPFPFRQFLLDSWLNCSMGISGTRCNQVAQSKCCHPSGPTWLTPAPWSIPLLSVAFLPAAASVRESTSGSRPSANRPSRN